MSANQTEPGRLCSIGRLIRWRGELRARKAGHGVLKPLRILPVAVPFGGHLLQRVAALAGSSPIEHARVGRITTPAQRQPRATRLALVADSENRLVRIPPGSRTIRKLTGFQNRYSASRSFITRRPLDKKSALLPLAAMVGPTGPVYDKAVSRPRYCFRVEIRALLTNGDNSLMWVPWMAFHGTDHAHAAQQCGNVRRAEVIVKSRFNH